MAIDQKTRDKMGEQAIRLAKNVGYFSAGTVEFLVDKNLQFYFLEMNTRLQVEHPITELITGVDLVEQMIRVASGQELKIKQADLKINGWAFESRVYAEDSKLFLPSIGRLQKYSEPHGAGIRCDSGVREGSEISIYYDPLICKLCTHAESREKAIEKMSTALGNYIIRGVTHNIPILHKVFSQKRFKNGKITTKYLAEEFPTGFNGHEPTDSELVQIAVAAVYIHLCMSPSSLGPASETHSTPESLSVSLDGQDGKILVSVKDQKYYASIAGKTGKHVLCLAPTNLSPSAPLIAPRPPLLSIDIDGKPLVVQILKIPYAGRIEIQAWGTVYKISVQSCLERELSKHMISKTTASSQKTIKSPMSGRIVSIFSKAGDMVREGAQLAVIEAMKMQNIIRAPKSGTISTVNIELGQDVSANQTLMELAE